MPALTNSDVREMIARALDKLADSKEAGAETRNLIDADAPKKTSIGRAADAWMAADDCAAILRRILDGMPLPGARADVDGGRAYAAGRLAWVRDDLRSWDSCPESAGYCADEIAAAMDALGLDA